MSIKSIRPRHSLLPEYKPAVVGKASASWEVSSTNRGSNPAWGTKNKKGAVDC